MSQSTNGTINQQPNHSNTNSSKMLGIINQVEQMKYNGSARNRYYHDPGLGLGKWFVIPLIYYILRINMWSEISLRWVVVKPTIVRSLIAFYFLSLFLHYLLIFVMVSLAHEPHIHIIVALHDFNVVTPTNQTNSKSYTDSCY